VPRISSAAKSPLPGPSAPRGFRTFCERTPLAPLQTIPPVKLDISQLARRYNQNQPLMGIPTPRWLRECLFHVRLNLVRKRGNWDAYSRHICHKRAAGVFDASGCREAGGSGRSTAAAKCLCVLQADAGPKVAILQDIRGQVLVADAAGYTPVKSGAELSIGDRIILLGGGKAKLAAGPTCQKQLASGSIVSIVANEKNVCISQALRVTAAADLPPPPPEEEDDDLLGLLLFGASAAAGGISIHLLTRDGDRAMMTARSVPEQELVPAL
jgi:hypothetical protein